MNDQYRYAQIASRLFGQPLLLTPDSAETIGQFILQRQSGEQLPQANRMIGAPQFDHDDRWKGYRKEGKVGIISVVGELVNRGAYMGASSGLVSYEGIQHQAKLIGEDNSITHVVIEYNTPGGEALGMSDTARGLKELLNGKKLISVVNSLAASAGYGLACVGDEVVIGESAVAGSIGVVILHLDQSERLAGMGLKPTFLYAGNTKVLGNGFEELSEDARNHLQSKVDECMDGFVSLVADHRSALTAEKIAGLEANTFTGQKAIEVGLADRIGTVQSVVNEINGVRGGRIFSARKELKMDNENSSPEANQDTGISAEAHQAAVETARHEGEQAGAAAASERFAGALAAEGVQGNATRMSAALDLLTGSPDMSAEAVAAFVTKNVGAETSTGDRAEAYAEERTQAAALAAPNKDEPKKKGLTALVDKKVGA
jgi:signal peptide peptidase SppA